MALCYFVCVLFMLGFLFICNTQVHRAGARKSSRLELPFFSFQIHCIPVCTNSDQGCVDEMNRFMDTYLLRACSTQYAVYSAWLGYKV